MRLLLIAATRKADLGAVAQACESRPTRYIPAILPRAQFAGLAGDVAREPLLVALLHPLQSAQHGAALVVGHTPDRLAFVENQEVDVPVRGRYFGPIGEDEVDLIDY